MNKHTVHHVLDTAYKSIDRLDAQLILAQVLAKPRSFLIAWPEHNLSAEQIKTYQVLIDKRAQGYPLAYITGTKSFWDMELIVTPDVLIPRPDTELLVETALAKVQPGDNILELATGSGAIACALARERTDISILASDISIKALDIARNNAAQYDLSHVHFIHSDWFADIPEQKFDLIIANPPYLADTDPHLTTDIRYEPRNALVSGPHGLEDYQAIINKAHEYLKNDGWILFEHGCEQGADLRRLLTESQYSDVLTLIDISGLERVTGGVCNQQ